jgi:hypothetical protein
MWIRSSRSTALEIRSPDLPVPEEGFASSSRPRSGTRYAEEVTPVRWLCALSLRESHEGISNMNKRRLPLQTYFQIYHQSRSPFSRGCGTAQGSFLGDFLRTEGHPEHD